MHQKLPIKFYQNSDVVAISKLLLGKFLCTNINGIFTSGMITETEAYCGATDKACHAYPNKKTPRTEIMFERGGFAYVYLCYGIHSLFNVVTNTEGNADAVLIRAIKAENGLPEILKRRKMNKPKKNLSAGPGTLTQALGITTALNKTNLLGDTIWIEDRNVEISVNKIVSTKRIGIDYAEEDALLPWRFLIKS